MDAARRRFGVIIIVILILAGSVGRAEGEEVELVGLGDVEQGSLLIKTDAPGRFLTAPLVSTDVELTVQGMIGRARVKQRFRNPTERCVEAVYVFPLPDDSAVDRMQLVVGQRIIEGEIHEKAEAKRIYDVARSEGRRASLLDQQRPNLFTVSVSNLAEDEEIETIIEYQQIVSYEGGEFSLRFPMVVGPRYNALPIPVSELFPRVGLRLDPFPGFAMNPAYGPAQQDLNPTRLVVNLDTGMSLRSLESPSHEVQTETLGGGRFVVRLVEGERSDRDFVLKWSPDLGREPSMAFFTESRFGSAVKDAGEEHYSVLMVLPPDPGEVSVRIPRETVFVIDTSGSMGGASIRQAKAALLFALDQLRPSDRFNVVEFNSQARALFEESRFADFDEVDRARKFVERLDAEGGTEMQKALEIALSDENPRVGEVRQVIFITDGMVGNESRLFAYIGERLGRARLFPVGIGSAPNSHFMTGAARFGRGTFTFVSRREEVAERMEALFRKLDSPVLTDLRIDVGDPEAEVWPSRPPDLYSGEPLVIALKTKRPVDRAVLSGSIGGRGWSETRQLSGAGWANESGIARLWAGRKIDSLMDQLIEGVDESIVREAVVDVALDYRLVSRYTSFVAVDKTPVGETAVCERVLVPVNMPQGMTMAPGGALPATATASPLIRLVAIVLLLVAMAVGLVQWRFKTGRGLECGR